MKKAQLPTVKLVYDRKKGSKLIELRLYFKANRQRLLISTGVKTDYWDHSFENISNNAPDYFSKINTLREVSDEINQAIYDLKNSIYPFTKESFLKFFRNGEKEQSEKRNFITFCEEEVERQNIAPGTKRHNKTTFQLLKEFKQPLYMSDLNYDFVSKFDSFLHNKEFKEGKHYSQNTITKHHKIIRKFAGIATAKKLMSADDLANLKSFKYPGFTSGKSPLTEEELEAVENLNYKFNERNRIHRDAFLFSCYTGIRISDTITITPAHFKKIDGQIKLTKLMVKLRKQNKSVTLPIEKLFGGKPYEIIKPYLESKEDNECIFDKSEQEINRVLKSISIDAKIRPITFHVARHTFLTNLAAKSGNVFTVMEYGGLGNISTAQNYIKLAQKRLDQGLDDINW